jgi:hypothetical protein
MKTTGAQHNVSSNRARLRSVSVLLAAMVMTALLTFCQTALATASASFTVNEVDKAGNTVQVGSWPFDSANHTLVGAPFVQSSMTSTDAQGDTLPYVPYSGTDAMPANKLAAATSGIYLDDLAAWVAAQNGVPLGGDTAFNVICADTDPYFYWSEVVCVTNGGSKYPLTLSWVDDADGAGRYWYPSYSYGSSAKNATFDESTRVPRRAMLAICGYSARRYQVTPQNPLTYVDLLEALSFIADQNDDSSSLTFFMGQQPNNRTELNLGMLQAKWIQSLTFTPAYRKITTAVAGGGGTATVTTDDGFLKATAGEPVSFGVGDITSGYRIESVTVTDADGQAVALSDTAGGYSFVMPASDATISVRLFTSVKIDLGEAVVAAVPAQAYTGRTIKPALSVTYAGRPLAEDVDFVVAYTKNRAMGAATATITGIGSCTGLRSTKFFIVPGKPVVRGVKSGYGSATVTWKKSAGGVDGYKVAYCVKGAPAFRIAGTTSGLSEVVNGLHHGRAYSFKVRGYTVIDGRQRCGGWSRLLTRTVR